jgi:hypothetical protein
MTGIALKRSFRNGPIEMVSCNNHLSGVDSNGMKCASLGLKLFSPCFSFELVVPGNLLKTELSLEFSGEKAQLVAYQRVFPRVHNELLI